MSEKIMYVLVPYNLSDIQKGIQASHAIAEYVFYHSCESKLIDWLEAHKTIIIINGGTTGEDSSMYRYHDDLRKLNIEFTSFQEPDLNDAMTAIAFVLDMEKDSHVIGYLKQMRLA